MAYSWSALTGEQIRAARSLARIEQTELARRTQLSVETIKRLERIRGLVDANSRTLNAIGGAFEELGIRFATGNDGNEGVWRTSRPEPSPPGRQTGRGSGEGRILHRLIYHSRLTDPVDHFPRNYDTPKGVSGSMLALDGRLLHAIEGDLDVVRLVFAGLATDVRHTAISVIGAQPISARLFGEWSTARGLTAADLSDLRQEPSLADGFRPERLSPAAALGLLLHLRDPATAANSATWPAAAARAL